MGAETGILFEQLNPIACRTYLIGSRETREVILVDPVLGSCAHYLKRLAEDGLTLRYVIDTHTHADHVSGGRFLSERTGAEYAMHKKAGAKHVELRLNDGSRLSIGPWILEVIETPGHTKDSITLKLPGRVLTGDWLFIGGAGRTDLPGGDPRDHWESLNRVIPSLDEDTIVSPGHDYEMRGESVLREEKRTNVNLRPRGVEEYVAWLSSQKQPTPEWMIATVRANQEGTMDPTVNFMPEDAGSVCMRKPAAAAGAPEVSVDEAKRLKEMGGAQLFLDVRGADEYLGPLGHLPGAVLIPLPELSSRLEEIDGYRDQTVVTICRSGSRSAAAAEILRNAGFRSALNMAGGMLAWRERGFPVES